MKIVIFGTTEYSEYVYYTMLAEGINNIAAFTMTRAYIDKNTFCDLPVFPFEELELYLKAPFEILITVGYPKMNQGRVKIYNLCKKMGYKVGSFISKRSICDSSLIGEGCIIMPLVYVPPITKLGVCNIVNNGTVIGHTGIVGDFNWFSGNSISGGNIQIDNYCFFGMNSVVKNGVHVASYTLVDAFSYVLKDTVEGFFYTGNPARNVKNFKSRIVVDFI